MIAEGPAFEPGAACAAGPHGRREYESDHGPERHQRLSWTWPGFERAATHEVRENRQQQGSHEEDAYGQAECVRWKFYQPGKGAGRHDPQRVSAVWVPMRWPPP
jgi:hypothetical protein